jgi:hypothetical protein
MRRAGIDEMSHRELPDLLRKEIESRANPKARRTRVED